MLPQPGFHRAEAVFRNGEDHRDGLHLGDDGESERAARLHHVAGIDETQADAAADGRSDVAVVDLHLIELHSAFVVFHDAFILCNQLFLVGFDLLGDGVSGQSGFVAIEIKLRLGEHVLILFKHALRLQQGGAVGARVDVDERVALFYQLAFFVIDVDDLAVHLAGDRGGVNRRDSADRVEIDADVALRALQS